MSISREQQSYLAQARHSCEQGDSLGAFELLRHVVRDDDIVTGREDLDPAWLDVWDRIPAAAMKGYSRRAVAAVKGSLGGITRVDEGIWSVRVDDAQRVVFLLGAGASKAEPSNIPTVTELLPELWVRAAKVGREDLDKLAGWCKDNDISNIEDLLTAAYIANFCAKNRSVVGLLDYFLFHRDQDEQESLGRPYVGRRVVGTRADAATVVLFQETLQTLFGLLTGTMISAGPNAVHKAIAQLVKRHPCTSVITTNYDGCVDQAIENSRVKWNFHIGGAVAEEDLTMPELIKMHGSINWFFCESCQEMTAVTLSAVRRCYERDETGYPVIGICRACGGQRRPMIVPPQSLKFLMFPQLMQLWDRARTALQESSVIVAVGYSFSDADAYITKMVSRAMSGDESRRLIIVDPDRSLVDRMRGRLSAHIPSFDEARVLRAASNCVEVIPDLCLTFTGRPRKAKRRARPPKSAAKPKRRAAGKTGRAAR